MMKLKLMLFNASELPLSSFDAILQMIIHAPVKARNWQVYPVISQHYTVN